MKIALVCIAKNEDNYIDEWINYHLKLGFTHIFVYANDWKYSSERNEVTVIDFPGINKQREAYADFLSKYREYYDWAAFFDVDEFLVLKKHESISEMLNEYRFYNSLAINWVMFGDNGHESVKDGNYSLLKRFTRRQKGVNEHIKSILNLKNNTSPMDIHNPVSVVNVDLNGNKVDGPFNYNGDDSIAQLNHYYSKTIEEFKEKVDRGRADAFIKNEYHFRDIHNHNEIEDILARDFLYELQ